jgi:hypothetical protein
MVVDSVTLLDIHALGGRRLGLLQISDQRFNVLLEWLRQ